LITRVPGLLADDDHLAKPSRFGLGRWRHRFAEATGGFAALVIANAKADQQREKDLVSCILTCQTLDK
jgi:hypothetical protein